MQLPTLTDRFDERLNTDAFADIDASANGLQVGNEGPVDHVAFAVDAVLETIDRAIEAEADVLVTHHGLVWGGLDRLTGRTYERVARLVRGDLALYVAHLPLDGHPDLGNAPGVGDILELEDRVPFGAIDEKHLGLRGRLATPASIEDIRRTLERALDTGGVGVQVLDVGPDELESIAIVTGSGADWLTEAAAADVDAFVTGEGKAQLYHEAKEAGITVFLAGHYATETFGVQRLQALAEEWGLETTYIDCPTGL